MTLFGLHLIDVILVVLFLSAMIWLGYWSSGRTKNTTDFFLAGRKLGAGQCGDPVTLGGDLGPVAFNSSWKKA